MSNVVIKVENLSKQYRIGAKEAGYKTFRESIVDAVKTPFRHLSSLLSAPRSLLSPQGDTIWALKEVSFEVKRGEVVGIIGRNGAGKSTLLKILSKITEPTEGRVELRGRVGSLLEVGTGFHPELTGHENVYLYGAILGMDRWEVTRKFDEIVAFAELDKFIDTPVKRYSSGMYMRLAFAVAAHLEPEILMVDEVLAVGDAQFQKKCLGKMQEVGSQGRTVIFVSHNMPMILRLCERVIFLDQGRILGDGPPTEAVNLYMDTGSGNNWAEQVWDKPDDAPGDAVVRLRAVRVLNHEGRVSQSIDISKPMSVEVEYWNQQTKIMPTAILHFINEAGICLFATNEFNSPQWRETKKAPGLILAICNIPSKLFAEGRIYVLTAVGSYNPNIVHVQVPDVVSFQVIDKTDGGGVRGEYGGRNWPGVIRPWLEWEVSMKDLNL